MTVTSVAVVTAKFLFGVCNCTVDNVVGKGDSPLVLEILHVCRYVDMRSHVSPDMDC